MSVRRIVLGAGVAIVTVFMLVVPSIDGVSTWKYVLGAIGLVLFFLAGRDRPTKT